MHIDPGLDIRPTAARAWDPGLLAEPGAGPGARDCLPHLCPDLRGARGGCARRCLRRCSWVRLNSGRCCSLLAEPGAGPGARDCLPTLPHQPCPLVHRLPAHLPARLPACLAHTARSVTCASFAMHRDDCLLALRLAEELLWQLRIPTLYAREVRPDQPRSLLGQCSQRLLCSGFGGRVAPPADIFCAPEQDGGVFQLWGDWRQEDFGANVQRHGSGGHPQRGRNPRCNHSHIGHC